MGDVKWIKICTDIFDDEKILLIESLPDSDAVITIWFKLLCLAGKQNNSGVFTLHDKIAYTDEMFATIFRRPLNTVRFALDTFENFGMIERVNGVVTIPHWNKHQSLDALEKKRERNREYMAKKREEQKLLISSPTVVPQKDYGSPLEEDKNRKEKKEKKNKNTYGSFENVKLTFKEFDKLRDEFGEQETLKTIEFFSSYIAEKGYKSKSHYLAMRRWVFDAARENEARSMKNQQPVF